MQIKPVTRELRKKKNSQAKQALTNAIAYGELMKVKKAGAKPSLHVRKLLYSEAHPPHCILLTCPCFHRYQGISSILEVCTDITMNLPFFLTLAVPPDGRVQSFALSSQKGNEGGVMKGTGTAAPCEGVSAGDAVTCRGHLGQGSAG